MKCPVLVQFTCNINMNWWSSAQFPPLSSSFITHKLPPNILGFTKQLEWGRNMWVHEACPIIKLSFAIWIQTLSICLCNPKLETLICCGFTESLQEGLFPASSLFEIFFNWRDQGFNPGSPSFKTFTLSNLFVLGTVMHIKVLYRDCSLLEY